MDSFELNKILGAILGTLLFVMGVGFLAEAIYSPATGGPGYDLPEPVDEGTGDNSAQPPARVDIGTLLASADPTAGQASAKKCQSCHDFTEGGPNKTGPNLYGIVGEKVADVPGYAFSDALKAHENETWTYENLDEWLLSPKGWAPGTKMTFAGVKDDEERADIIAYLSTLSHSPVPFPAPAPSADEGVAPDDQTTDATSSVDADDAVTTPTEMSGETNAPGGTGTTGTEEGASDAAPAASSAEAPAPASEAASEASSEVPSASEAVSEEPASEMSSAAQ